MNARWRVCKYRSVWSVREPDGTWSGDFETWTEAMDWATSFASRIEWWLEVQTRRTP